MDFKSFVIELTADGSPTLRLKQRQTGDFSEKPPESMHHSGGAASETVYIYTQPFKKLVDVALAEDLRDLQIGIVGLGLGYIELSILQNLAANYEKFEKINLVSFEKEQELNTACEQWLTGKNNFNSTYDLLFEKLCEKNKAPSETLNFIRSVNTGVYSQIHWCRDGEISFQTKVAKKFNYVAYDAFSQYTNSPLWGDEFLDWFLINMCDRNCLFTTYACTGSLKRALQRNDFLVVKRRGFSGKRDATLALRGEFKVHQELFQSV